MTWLKASLPADPAGAGRRAAARRCGIVAVVAGVAGAAFPFLGEEFLPHFKEYDFLMHWVEKPGTSLDAMRGSRSGPATNCARFPGVRNFGAHIGRAEVADEVVGTNFTELWISLDPDGRLRARRSRRFSRSSMAIRVCSATCSPICASGSRRC